MIFENTTFHLSDKYLFLKISLSAELSEKQECSKIGTHLDILDFLSLNFQKRCLR